VTRPSPSYTTGAATPDSPTNERSPTVFMTSTRSPTGMSIDTAADLIWAFTSTDIDRMLVIERHWSAQRYRAWLRSATAAVLT
jgi:hypothetical protein